MESPQLTDILPIKFAYFLVDHQFFLSNFKSLLHHIINFRRQSSTVETVRPSANDDSENDAHRTLQKSPVIRMNDIVPEMATNRNAPVVSYLTTSSSTSSPSFENNQSLECRGSNRPWSDEEKQLLCKTVVRFPPGTPRRWEKIADVIDRPIVQVVDMAKEIQNTVGSNTNYNTLGHDTSHSLFPSTVTIDQNLITEREQFESVSDWSQGDQHLFECALKTIPKDTPGVDRWEQIAGCVPGKTRDECLARYRYIAQLLKAKKSSKSSSETKKRV